MVNQQLQQEHLQGELTKYTLWDLDWMLTKKKWMMEGVQVYTTTDCNLSEVIAKVGGKEKRSRVAQRRLWAICDTHPFFSAQIGPLMFRPTNHPPAAISGYVCAHRLFCPRLLLSAIGGTGIMQEAHNNTGIPIHIKYSAVGSESEVFTINFMFVSIASPARDNKHICLYIAKQVIKPYCTLDISLVIITWSKHRDYNDYKHKSCTPRESRMWIHVYSWWILLFTSQISYWSGCYVATIVWQPTSYKTRSTASQYKNKTTNKEWWAALVPTTTAGYST